MKLFQFMSDRPWPFLVAIPIVLIVLTAVGWSRDDIVEDEVGNIWIPSDGAFAKDKDYAASVGKDGFTATSFLAMAVSRDSGNIFTADRLKEIRDRMEAAEATTVEHNGVIFDWNDLCSSNNVGLGTTYEFPCLRLSPMDLFQEARWFFHETDRVTWYNEVIQKLLVRPRIPRFGIMTEVCSSEGALSKGNFCDEQLALRSIPGYAASKGYPDGYQSQLQLFTDIGALENSDPCKICIENGYEETLQFLTDTISGVFNLLAFELNRALESGNVVDVKAHGLILQKVVAIAGKIDRQEVEDFYKYFVTRGLYVELGEADYVKDFMEFMAKFKQACLIATGFDEAACPSEVDLQEARRALKAHADNTFSSHSTAGLPLPFFDENGIALFNGTLPFGGSGINMDGTLLSTTEYLDAENVGTADWRPLYFPGTIDIASDSWIGYVDGDPVYKWFMAGETAMSASCGNDDLPGTRTNLTEVDGPTASGMQFPVTRRWCTEYNLPFEEDEVRTVQHFARMWYDLLIDSDGFLGIVQGESDPYTWTNGQGCDYVLKGERDAFSGQDEATILTNASRQLYYIDEGASSGAIDRNLLMGGTTPAIGSYDFANPLQTVTVVQSLYPTVIPSLLVERVKNCNRPGGQVEITEEDAEEILYKFKEAFEDNWTDGWDDDDDGEVQFVGFYDDVGVIGTTGRLLTEITLSNGPLMAVSIIIIAVFSAVFLFSCDVIQSRVLVTTIGVALVIVSFFAALGLGIILGIKVNVNIAWTLPFIILGLGVDDMYIVILALVKRGSFSQDAFIAAMKEIVVPVTMTSLVNASMFAIMNIVDVPAVYLTAQMALISVIFLYFTIVFCYPAYCWLDMKRQAAGRYDVLVCLKKEQRNDTKQSTKFNHESRTSSVGLNQSRVHGVIYEFLYRPLIIQKGILRTIAHVLVWLGAFALLGVGIYGITQRSVGLGLEDFFPASHQANRWATIRTEELASWSVSMNWGALDYGDPAVQMKIIQQFERVVDTEHISEVDTKALWIADFNIWTTTMCTANFDRDDPDVLVCGMNQLYPEDNSTCAGLWVENSMNLREKLIPDPKDEKCYPNELGICRQEKDMHPADLAALAASGVELTGIGSFCPVFSGWSDEKLQWCLGQWRFHTGGGGNLVFDEKDDLPTANAECAGEYYRDDQIQVPIPYSSGPTMFSIFLNSHEDTLDMIRETRAICDDDDDTHCWITGIPYNYWEQYLWVEDVLLQIGGAAVGVGFAVSALFLILKFLNEGNHPPMKIVIAGLVGALFIAMITIISLISVIGLSVLAEVNLTAFSDMSFVLSVGFAVEYAVHIVHRFLKAPLENETGIERVEHAMSFLALPTFMSFVSSTIGVVCLAFTEFNFNEVFFFRPLIIVMFVTYFYGCWFLPVFLSLWSGDMLKMGKFSDDVAFAKDDQAPSEGPLEDSKNEKPESPLEAETDDGPEHDA